MIDFDNDDVYILMLIGTIISGIIENFRTRNKLRIYNEMTEMLIKLESEKNNFMIQNVYQFVVDNLVDSTTPYKVAIISYWLAN